MTFNTYKQILLKNCKTIKKNKKPNFVSLPIILDLPLFHSIYCQLGNKFEDTINEYVDQIPNVINMQQIHKKLDGHQIDVLFKYKKTIYYFEVKSSLDFDTEKAIKIKEKFKNVQQKLKEKYPKYKSKSKILSPINYSIDDIDESILRNNITIKDIYCCKDFFNIFDIDVSYDMFHSKLDDFSETIHKRIIDLNICSYLTNEKYLKNKCKLLEKENKVLVGYKRKYMSMRRVAKRRRDE